jgi:hypothetical protein
MTRIVTIIVCGFVAFFFVSDVVTAIFPLVAAIAVFAIVVVIVVDVVVSSSLASPVGGNHAEHLRKRNHSPNLFPTEIS